MAKVFAMGYWTSQTCDNSLGSMPSQYPTTWGKLTWKQEAEGDNFVRVDILNTSGSILVSDITGQSTDLTNYTIDISKYSDVGDAQDIKIRFRLYRISGKCRVYDIYLNKKVEGMVTTNILGKEIRDWLACQKATGDSSTTDAPNRFLFGTGSASPTTSDTALGNELTDEAFSETPTKGELQVTYFGELGSGEQNGNTLREGGIADNTTDKNLYGRFIHTDISKTSGKTVSYEFTIALEVS